MIIELNVNRKITTVRNAAEGIEVSFSRPKHTYKLILF